MHEVLVDHLGGLSLPRKSAVRLTDRPDMTLDVYRGCKTTIQQIPRCSPVESLKTVAYGNLETKLNAIDDFSYVRSSVKYRPWPNMHLSIQYIFPKCTYGAKV